MALRAVLFDIDDTLYSTTQFAKLARQNAVRAMITAGLDVPEDRILFELDEVIREFSSNYDHHFDQLLRRLRPRALERVNPAVIVAAGVVAYHDTKFRELAPFPDAIPLLADLKKAGVKTGVVTHGWTSKQAEKLIRLGVLPHLDPRAIFISEQLGVSKPNPKIYALALQDLGLQPAEAMYVGDNPEHDVAPPKSIGMATCFCRRAARKDIAETGIVPDFSVDDFGALRRILRERFDVAV